MTSKKTTVMEKTVLRASCFSTEYIQKRIKHLTILLEGYEKALSYRMQEVKEKK